MLVFDMMRYGTEEAQKNLDGRWDRHPMMYGDNGNLLWIHLLFGLITWLLVIAVLVALVRFLWKKGDHAK